MVKGDIVERRKVETGRITHSFMEIVGGLEEDETVALDAYQRGLADFAKAEKTAPAAPLSPPDAAGPG